MGEQLYTPGQSGNWQAPFAGECLVECWGGGGTGGGGSGNNEGGGGGAGGQYASKTVTIVKDQNYAYSVAADRAGVGKDTNGLAGYSTYLGPAAAPLVRAMGGAGGLAFVNGGTGGQGSDVSGIGDTVYAGGDGAASGAGYGGGGGGGAGSSGAGNDASGSTGGAAKAENGGAGGNGYVGASGAGLPGEDYGGAGGGATKAETSGGGNGGYLKITWEDIAGSKYDLNFREYGYRLE